MMKRKVYVRALTCLEALESISSRNDRVALLSKHKDNKVLKQIFAWAYSGDVYYVFPEPLPKTAKISAPADAPEDVAQAFRNFGLMLEDFRTRKLTGNAAQRFLHDFFFPLDPLLYKWFYRIMHRDLRIGTNVSTLDMVWTNGELWPERSANSEEGRFPYPGCKNSHQEYVWQPEWKYRYADTKMDGYRLSAVIGSRSVVFYSREGKHAPYTENLAFIGEQLLSFGFRNVMIDGEIMVRGWTKTGKIRMKKMPEDVRKYVHKHATFCVFDLVPVDAKSGKLLQPDLTFRQRRAWLHRAVGEGTANVRPTELWKVYSDAEVQIAYESVLDMGPGYEGLIVKDPDSLYVPGSRNRDWQKLKPEDPFEAKIVGFEPGKGKHEGKLGAFLCIDERGHHVRLGGGMKDDQRERWWKMRKKLLGYWVEGREQKQKKGDKVATSRHPRFKLFRNDRNPTVVE